MIIKPLPGAIESDVARLPASTLYRNSFAAFLGRGAYAGGQWALVVIIARLMNPEAVGRYGVAIAVAAPVFSLLSMDLRALIGTDCANRYSIAEYVHLRAVTTLAASATVIGMARVINWSGVMPLVLSLIVLGKALDSIGDILQGIMQRNERMDLAARSSLLKGILSVVGMAAALALTRSLAWGLLLVAVSWAAMILGYDLPWALRLSRVSLWARQPWRRQWVLTCEAIPLGLVAVLLSLQMSIPRLFLEAYQGSRAVGHFTVMGHFLIAGAIANGAIQQGLGPRLASYYAARDQARFFKLFGVLCGMSLLLSLFSLGVVIWFGAEILSFVYGPAYTEQSHVLPYLMLAGVGMYLFASMSTALTVMRSLVSQSWIVAFSAVACLVGSRLLIPPYGVRGAALAIVVAALTSLCGSGVVLFARLRGKSELRTFAGQ